MSNAFEKVGRASSMRIAAVDSAILLSFLLLLSATRRRSQNLRRSLRSVKLKIVVCGVHVWLLLFSNE
jgi:ABC-type cobalamin transport system permease subunit